MALTFSCTPALEIPEGINPKEHWEAHVAKFHKAATQSSETYYQPEPCAKCSEAGTGHTHQGRVM